jgi:hypothetical protein
MSVFVMVWTLIKCPQHSHLLDYLFEKRFNRLSSKTSKYAHWHEKKFLKMISRLYSGRQKVCFRFEYTYKEVDVHILVALIGVLVEHAATQIWHHTTLTSHLNRRIQKHHTILGAHFFAPDQRSTTSFYV